MPGKKRASDYGKGSLRRGTLESDARYREGWERIFGKPKASTSKRKGRARLRNIKRQVSPPDASSLGTAP
jgi:hypothetical protein